MTTTPDGRSFAVVRPHVAWQGTRACVTGGTGFLGYQIVQQLLELGARVRSLSLPPTVNHPIRGRGVELVEGDIRDAATVARAVHDCQVVFHTAGTVATFGPAVERMIRVHREGTKLVLAHADPQCRIIHTSSVVAVGASIDAKPLDESSPFNLADAPVAYIRAKVDAERLAFQAVASGRDLVVVNPSFLIGPDDHEKSVMGRYCLRFWKGRVPVIVPGGLNVVDVRDVAAGHILAAEFGITGERYILSGEDRTWGELVRDLAVAAHAHPRFAVPLPIWSMPTIAAVAEWRARRSQREPYPSRQDAYVSRYHWYYDSKKAIDLLGYRPRQLGRTLADAFAWHARQGNLTLRGWHRWFMRPKEAA